MRDISEFAIVAVLFGLVGRYLNIVIHNLPRALLTQPDNFNIGNRNKFTSYIDSFKPIPFSRCEYACQRVPIWQKIPVAGYVFSGGKCGVCRAPISFRTPLVELITAVLSTLLMGCFGFDFYGLSALLCLYFLILLTFIDIDTQLLPDRLTYPLLCLGLLVNLNSIFVPFENAVAGAIIGYALFTISRALFKRLTGKEGIGYGDIKLIAALGAWFGISGLLIIIALAAIVSLLISMVLIVFTLRERNKPFPFGPYLTIASVFMLFYNQPLTQLWHHFL